MTLSELKEYFLTKKDDSILTIGNTIIDSATGTLDLIVNFIKNNTQLRTVAFANHVLDKESILIIFDALSQNANLNALSFESQQLQDTEVINKLFDLYQLNQNLTSISLYDSDVSCEVVPKIISLLKTHPRIEELWLPNVKPNAIPKILKHLLTIPLHTIGMYNLQKQSVGTIIKFANTHATCKNYEFPIANLTPENQDRLVKTLINNPHITSLIDNADNDHKINEILNLSSEERLKIAYKDTTHSENVNKMLEYAKSGNIAHTKFAVKYISQLHEMLQYTSHIIYQRMIDTKNALSAQKMRNDHLITRIEKIQEKYQIELRQCIEHNQSLNDQLKIKELQCQKIGDALDHDWNENNNRLKNSKGPNTKSIYDRMCSTYEAKRSLHNKKMQMIQNENNIERQKIELHREKINTKLKDIQSHLERIKINALNAEKHHSKEVTEFYTQFELMKKITGYRESQIEECKDPSKPIPTLLDHYPNYDSEPTIPLPGSEAGWDIVPNE